MDIQLAVIAALLTVVPGCSGASRAGTPEPLAVPSASAPAFTAVAPPSSSERFRLTSVPLDAPVQSAKPVEVRPECPSGMAKVKDVCMDLYEAPNEKGKDPIVMVSALEAEDWCKDRGKRLCTEAEWTVACRGPQNFRWPYGNTFDPAACNTGKPWIQMRERTIGEWPDEASKTEIARLWQGEPSGSRDTCVSGYGIYDLVGNAEEWTSRSGGKDQFNHALKGRFWSGYNWDCERAIYSHADKWRYYEVGFRCCASVSAGG